MPDLVKSIFEGVRRTQEIIGSLRIYSRMDSTITDKKDIHELIHGALQILKSRYKKEIQLKTSFSSVPLVTINSGKIIQVLVNIVSNAIDAIMEKGGDDTGVISIKTGIREVDGINYVVVDITDNGTGIPEAIKGKVLDPFFTTKDVGQGTGLGLSISIGIVREHKGMIEIESNADEGTIVSVFLPVDEKDMKNNAQ